MMTVTGRGVLLAMLLAGGLTGPSDARSEGPGTAALTLEAAVQVRLVDGDLGRAIELYEQLVAKYRDDRPVAAEALLGLGQCYEQLGDPKARRTYERLLQEYGGQTRQADTARSRLAALSEADPAGEDSSDLVVREVWERPQPGVSPLGGFPRFVIFNDLSVLRWNPDQEKPETRRLSGTARSAAYPVLSPDQRQVAYLSWSGNLEERFGQGDRARPRSWAELRIVGVDGSDDRGVYRSRNTPWLRPLAWSPDGEQILTVLEQREGKSDMALVSVEDGSARVVKSLKGRTPVTVSFSPDGRSFAYDLPVPRNARRREFFVVQLQEDGAQSRPAETRYVMSMGAGSASGAGDDLDVIHVLNRIGFGPRPGDIERVKAMGVEAYIEQQLHPERIPDPLVDEKLATFSSLKMGPEQLLERLGPAAPSAVRSRATIFEKAAMAQRKAQGRGRPVDNNTLTPDSYQSRAMLLEGRPEDFEIQKARIIRAVYSERQLLELMVDFWMNHFNINHGDHQLTADFEEHVIRAGALGRFEDLLMAVAKHPRMLNYLDNWRSSAPADVIEQRIAARKATLGDEEYLALLERMPFLKEAQGLNENYARELMELHTLGIDGGYTQQDVIEVAKIFTGWTISGKDIINGREDDGVFAFDPLLHVNGDKVVLGETIPSGGIDEGERLLGMLARHPSTARFIVTKLARRFVADDPPAEVIEAAGRTFQKTGGDIREVLRTIFTSAQFRSPETYQSKIKKPLELVVSSLRAVRAEIVSESFFEEVNGGRRGLLAQMGERLYSYETPDGNPDVGSAWMNSNALLLRLEFANTLATNRFPGVKPDLTSAQPMLKKLGLPTPTAEQIEQTRVMIQAAEADRSNARRQGMMMMAAGSQANGSGAEVTTAAITVGAMLGSPRFQKR